MKYYCKNCGSEYKFGKTVSIIESCADCSHVDDEYCEQPCASLICCACDVKLTPIPSYETPEQYEKRTGKAFPDNGIIFLQLQGRIGWLAEPYRMIKTGKYFYWKRYEDVSNIVIAEPPVPPPDDWKPEEDL
jgi:hypothetical protein